MTPYKLSAVRRQESALYQRLGETRHREWCEKNSHNSHKSFLQKYKKKSYLCIFKAKKMKKVLFVCHGNICRSVTAQFVFLQMAEEAGLAQHLEVDSAATSREEIGNPIYPMALRTLEAHGIHHARHAARQVTPADYDRFDLLVLMDRENLQGLRRIIPHDPQHKVSLLLDHTPPSDRSHHHRDVADPWYTRNFDQAWEDITIGCKALLEELRPALQR